MNQELRKKRDEGGFVTFEVVMVLQMSRGLHGMRKYRSTEVRTTKVTDVIVRSNLKRPFGVEFIEEQRLN